MILARFNKIKTGNAKPILFGTTNQDVPKGCAIMVQQNPRDGSWQLVAVHGDGRKIDHDPQNLLSFCDHSDEEIAAMRTAKNSILKGST